MFLKLPGCQEQKLTKEHLLVSLLFQMQNISFQNLRMCRSQNSKLLGLKVTQRAVTHVSTFFFCFTSLLFSLFAFLGPLIFLFCWLFFRLHFWGKVFWKAFRIVGFDGMSCGLNFCVKLACFSFCLFFPHPGPNYSQSGKIFSTCTSYMTELSLTIKTDNILLYKHQWNTRWAFTRTLDIFTCENNMLSSHVKISPLLWLHNKSHLSHQKTIKVKWFGGSLLRSLVKYFSTLKEKFRISARPCNILYICDARAGICMGGQGKMG